MGILVRAKALGIHAGSRKRPGDEFEIASEKELGKWMEVVTDAPPSSVPTPDSAEQEETSNDAGSGAAPDDETGGAGSSEQTTETESSGPSEDEPDDFLS